MPSRIQYFPAYARIRKQIEAAIGDGRYSPHDQLPSIAELSRQHGVSDGTVKRVLRDLVEKGLVYSINGKGTFVSDFARRGPVARSERSVPILYGRHPSSVHFGPFWYDVLEGIETELSEAGRGLEMVNIKSFPVDELTHARRQGAFPGLISAVRLSQEEMARLVRWGRITMALFVEYEPIPGLYCLGNDETAGVSAATRHLIESGCRKLGAIMVDDLEWDVCRDRLEGFLRECRRAFPGAEEPPVEFEPQFSENCGYAAMKRLLEREPEIDGVFAAHDMMAIGAMEYAEQAGIPIPARIKLVGYDDMTVSRLVRPRLTTMRVDRKAIGRCAARILLERLERPTLEFRVERTPPQLIVRESTGEAAQTAAKRTRTRVNTPARGARHRPAAKRKPRRGPA